MKDTNAMVLIYVRWTGQQFEQGYQMLQLSTKTWHPVPVKDIAAFLKDGGIVHMNPEFIPREI